MSEYTEYEPLAKAFLENGEYTIDCPYCLTLIVGFGPECPETFSHCGEEFYVEVEQ